MQIAETERLIIRPLTADDAEDLFGIYSRPENMEFLGRPPQSIEAERDQILRHVKIYYEKYGFGLWATVLKENNRLIGRCGLLYQEIEGSKELEVAYLIDHSCWGRGLATEAAQAIIKLGRERFNFKRLVAVIDPRNTASIRVAEKIGMKFKRIVNYKDYGKVFLYAVDFPN